MSKLPKGPGPGTAIFRVAVSAYQDVGGAGSGCSCVVRGDGPRRQPAEELDRVSSRDLVEVGVAADAGEPDTGRNGDPGA